MKEGTTFYFVAPLSLLFFIEQFGKVGFSDTVYKGQSYLNGGVVGVQLAKFLTSLFHICRLVALLVAKSASDTVYKGQSYLNGCVIGVQPAKFLTSLFHICRLVALLVAKSASLFSSSFL